MIQGSEYIDIIDGDNLEKCTISEKAKGTAQVQVTYKWGVDGINVLTGNLAYEHYERTQTYEIIVK